MADLNLPADLVAFLKAGKQLEYDPATCEAGKVELLALDQLKVQLFPMFIDDEELFALDPHHGENGYYLVEAINLVRECDGYHAVGTLIWLPFDNVYGTWDEEHWYIGVFDPETTWTKIVEAPAQHINAHWVGAFPDSVNATSLIPWPKYRYSAQRGTGPFPYVERP